MSQGFGRGQGAERKPEREENQAVTSRTRVQEQEEHLKNESRQEGNASTQEKMNPIPKSSSPEIQNVTEQITKRDKVIKFLNKELQNMEEYQDRKARIHRETVALLRSTQVALKQKEEECAGLEEQYSMKMAEQEQNHQAELKRREDIFQNELAEKIMEAKQETRRQLEEELQKKEWSWQKEMSQLQELAAERGRDICRAEQEGATRDAAFTETLALLGSTQAALQQREEEFSTLKDQHSQKLAEQEEKHQAELRDKEEKFKNELAQKLMEAKQELADLQKQWEAKEEAWGVAKRQLEETLQTNENIWKQKEASNIDQIQLLNDGLAQLQVSCLYLSCTCP